MKSRFAVIVSLLLAAGAFATGPRQEFAGKPSFTFVQLSDPHIKAGRAYNDRLFKAAIAKTNEMKPDFVLITGDLVETGAPENYDRFQELARGIKAKTYFLVGNHELQEGTLADFEKRFGKPYYSFVHKGVAFVCLNNTMRDKKGHSMHHSKLDEEQFAWFVKELARLKLAGAEQIVVASHMPVSMRMASYNTQRLDLDRFLPLLEKYNVTAHLAGHRHWLASSDEYQTLHIMSTQTWNRTTVMEYRVFPKGIQAHVHQAGKSGRPFAQKVAGEFGMPLPLDGKTPGEIARAGQYSVGYDRRRKRVTAVYYRGVPVFTMPLTQKLGFNTWRGATPYTVKKTDEGTLVVQTFPSNKAGIRNEIQMKEDGVTVTVEIDGFKEAGKHGYYSVTFPYHVIRGSRFRYAVRGKEQTIDFPRYAPNPQIRYLDMFEATTLYGFTLTVDWRGAQLKGVTGNSYWHFDAPGKQLNTSMAAGYWQYTPESSVSLPFRITCKPTPPAK